MAHIVFEDSCDISKVLPKGVNDLDGSFHILLGGRYSCSVTKKKKGGICIGLYKTDIRGRRRGVTLPYIVWIRLLSCCDILQTAVGMVNTTTESGCYVKVYQTGSTAVSHLTDDPSRE